MNVLITGSSGLIGAVLCADMILKGHTVYRMKRSGSLEEPFRWYPTQGKIIFDENKDIDVVVHLAGANIGEGRWSYQKKKRILESREIGTKLLSLTLANLKKKPKVLISGSAVGFYGSSGDTIIDETSNSGSGFLSHVCQKWENATKPASESGIRTVNIRTGVVLSRSGGVLSRMLFPFKMGLGGIVGNGKQYISWVSIHDFLNMIQFIINNKTISGPVNLVSKTSVTNYEFTKTLGLVLGKPTFFPFPSFFVKVIFGEMGDTLLLSSLRVVPQKLIESGYKFIHENLEQALKDVLRE